MNHNIGVTSADDSDGVPSSPETQPFDENDLLSSAHCTDEVTAQLAAAGENWLSSRVTSSVRLAGKLNHNALHIGPAGVAAAAAIATGKKRKRPHSFETNPSVRKRQQTRLLRLEEALFLRCFLASNKPDVYGFFLKGGRTFFLTTSSKKPVAVKQVIKYLNLDYGGWFVCNWAAALWVGSLLQKRANHTPSGELRNLSV